MHDIPLKTSEDEIVSTKLVMSKIWQRLLSMSILNYQLENFQTNKAFLKEAMDIFGTIEQFKNI